MSFALPVVNLAARDVGMHLRPRLRGHLLQERPAQREPKEQAQIKKVLKRALPLLRLEARALDRKGRHYEQARRKTGNPMLHIVDDSWCVFFNKGCVLHQLGAEDGDSYQYKPVQCALFPLDKDDKTGEWYVRQWGYKDEEWNLFCLNPKQSKQPAAESLAAEIELAEKIAG